MNERRSRASLDHGKETFQIKPVFFPLSKTMAPFRRPARFTNDNAYSDELGRRGRRQEATPPSPAALLFREPGTACSAEQGLEVYMTTISMIGTGYVGLVSGACLADFGNHVICVDTDIEKIGALRKGCIPIHEPGLDTIVECNTKAGRIQFTTDFAFSVKQTEVIFIAVGTPPADDGSADLSYVEQAARGIGQSIEKYTVVVDKSTVPVGTGRKVAIWIREELEKGGRKYLST
jgi:hypothetical protein